MERSWNLHRGSALFRDATSKSYVNGIEDYFLLEFTDEFAASIERGKKDIAEGNVRIRNPEQT